MNQNLHILIVDDDPSMTKTLADIFKFKGYQANVANSGAEALAKVAETPFDCILSDIKMPDINGVEMYKVIKVKQPNMPVVLMTAYSTDMLVKEGLKEGVVAVLTKPLDINNLLNLFSSL